MSPIKDLVGDPGCRASLKFKGFFFVVVVFGYGLFNKELFFFLEELCPIGIRVLLSETRLIRSDPAVIPKSTLGA